MSTWFVDGIKKLRNDDIIIAFVGPTGAGKSYYIDLLTGQPGRRAGHSLSAATTQIEAVRVKHTTYGDRIVLVDTPGINDSVRSSMQVLQMTSNWLQKTYKKSVKLNGLIYLHRITDNRLTEPLENLRMFRELCGDFAMTQVILVSTMWEELVLDEGASREKELEEIFWKPLIDKGSRLDRLSRSDPEEAWRIVDQLIRQNDTRAIQRMQEELKELELALQESYAGRMLLNSLQKALTEQRNSLRQLVFQNQKSDDPVLMKKLRKEYTRSEEQTRKTFEQIQKSHITIGKEILTVFYEKETRAKAVKIGD